MPGSSLTELVSRARACRADGDTPGALAALGDALTIAPGHPLVLDDYGRALGDDARYDEAIAVLAHAAAMCDGAAPWINLGNALRSYGRKDDAHVAFAAAILREPDNATAHFNMHAFARAAELGHPTAQFYVDGISDVAFLADSWEFAAAHPQAQRFDDTFDTLQFALSQARTDGLVVELGVRRGTSLRRIAAWCDRVHGFDAFEGLPEAWGGAVGRYSTGGQLPDVPPNVTLHAGWFRDTLPAFVAAQDGPLRFANVDCDLYRSTRTALSHLAPKIGSGTVLVFDEYLCNPGWRDEEHRAFVETAQQFGWRYRYVAFSLFSKQAAIAITA